MVFNNRYSSYKQDVEWNINQVFSEILKDIIIEINRTGLIGDVRGRFNACRMLYNNIHGHDKVDETILKTIDDKMWKVARKLKHLPDNIIATPLTKTQKMYMDIIKRLLDDINRDLIDQMYKAGLIFPISKKDARYSGMEIK